MSSRVGSSPLSLLRTQGTHMTDLMTRTLAPSPPASPEAEGSRAFAGTVAATLAVVVAPSTGRFRPAIDGRPQVRAGELLGHVTGGRGRADEVRSPVDAVVADLLVRAGQLVGRGQGLAWLQRTDIDGLGACSA